MIEALGDGLSNKDVAARFHLTEGTVKVYMTGLFRKLRMKTRMEVGLWYLKQEHVRRSLDVRDDSFDGRRRWMQDRID